MSDRRLLEVAKSGISAVSEFHGAVSGSTTATILCVDDEPAILLTLSLVLQSAGHKTLSAANAKDSIQLLRENHVDLVLIDYGISELGGRSVAELMKEIRPKLCVLVHSGDHTVAHNLPAGADDFIQKPEPPAELLAKVAARLAA